MKKQTVSRKELPLPWLRHMATKHRLRCALRAVGASGWKFKPGQEQFPLGVTLQNSCAHGSREVLFPPEYCQLSFPVDQIEWISPGRSPNPLYIKEKKVIKYSTWFLVLSYHHLSFIGSICVLLPGGPACHLSLSLPRQSVSACHVTQK